MKLNVVMNNSAFNFQTLSPDLIMDALEGVGLRVDSGLTALNSYENRVYQFMDEDRKRYVVEVLPARTLECGANY
ncbi:serine/threonine protein kinase [Serratia plymuthica]|uniref:Serine/threonine protein kinase n=1 Tax=Serratia plymuthica TaxID=82996 RepID=A0A2X4V525_SERPL|nr:serine/threonine protein kinase [Serratia plymuthica]